MRKLIRIKKKSYLCAFLCTSRTFVVKDCCRKSSDSEIFEEYLSTTSSLKRLHRKDLITSLLGTFEKSAMSNELLIVSWIIVGSLWGKLLDILTTQISER